MPRETEIEICKLNFFYRCTSAADMTMLWPLDTDVLQPMRTSVGWGFLIQKRKVQKRSNRHVVWNWLSGVSQSDPIAQTSDRSDFCFLSTIHKNFSSLFTLTISTDITWKLHSTFSIPRTPSGVVVRGIFKNCIFATILQTIWLSTHWFWLVLFLYLNRKTIPSGWGQNKNRQRQHHRVHRSNWWLWWGEEERSKGKEGLDQGELWDNEDIWLCSQGVTWGGSDVDSCFYRWNL